MEELRTLESFFWGFCGNASVLFLNLGSSIIAATEGDDSENRGAADLKHLQQT